MVRFLNNNYSQHLAINQLKLCYNEWFRNLIDLGNYTLSKYDDVVQ